MSSSSVTEIGVAYQSAKNIDRNLSIPELVEQAIKNGDGVLSADGALVAYTGKYTGRTPLDKRVVRDATTNDRVWWENNAEITPDEFAAILARANEVLPSKSLYIVDAWGGADPDHRIAVRVVVEDAYHALFIRSLLIRPTDQEMAAFQPEWTILDLGTETYERTVDGEQRDAMIALDFARRTVVILGTKYAGEMKKSVFTILNYLLPLKGVMSMHCAANIGADGDTALFFGLSGTGKTTLSTDPGRRLIGDDEHGWTDNGVFNFEGGCYAKCIKLSKEGEPQIYNAIRFGAVLENVVLDDQGRPDYDDGSITENTRCAYPIEFIDGAVIPSVGGHPENIVFLTADAFGVLPPISRLTPEQAMFHFLNGYTAKVAGTEAGVTEPQATFSSCFGQPFLPLPPKVYAELLKDKIARHGSKVWLVNTGWTGGPYGVGTRMKLAHTRAMIDAAFSGALDGVEYATDPVFGLDVPTSCPDVPSDVLVPRKTWDDKDAYDSKARELQGMFEENFKKYA
ncbi:MAG: phosphoenolpyruvate carboxykinase (ATP) [Armatimonadetes bacterium]|nr:phosphoenolpyruvate carboxykinase (ATP) [Armatimonadota bacterium]